MLRVIGLEDWMVSLKVKGDHRKCGLLFINAALSMSYDSGWHICSHVSCFGDGDEIV